MAKGSALEQMMRGLGEGLWREKGMFAQAFDAWLGVK